MDPSTGQLTHVALPGVDVPSSVLSVAPNGQQVAYVTPGSSATPSASLWPVSGAPAVARENGKPETVWAAPLDNAGPPRRIFELPPSTGPVGLVSTVEAEQIVDLVWTPDSGRLVAITHQAGSPARARVFLMDVGAETQANATELVLLPAEVIPGSSLSDPSGRWLALVTHAAPAPGGRDVLDLCALELRLDGSFRDLADLGAAPRLLGAAPITWAPATTDGMSDRLAFAAPVPAAASSGGGVFDFFSAFRASAPQSGLFVANLEPPDIQAGLPRRLGTVTNTLGPFWRSETSLFGLVPQEDGTLALRSIDAASGVVHDLGVRLPAGMGLCRDKAKNRK